MPKFDDFKNLKDAVGPKIIRFEEELKIFGEDNAQFKQILAQQDKTLLLKANKMALVDLEQQFKEMYAPKVIMESLTGAHDSRIQSLESETAKFNSKLEVFKYMLNDEVRSSVKRAV